MGHSSRRKFLRQSSLGAAGYLLGAGLVNSSFASSSVFSASRTPAALGGQPLFNAASWVKWPMWIQSEDEQTLIQSVRSGVWSRAKLVDEFESKWAAAVGVKRCLTVVNGTNALITAINQLDIGAGDEVITTPYTFIASVQAILANNAMPVFADVDPATYQIDPAKIEAKITKKTKAILVVHILGLPADMDRIMAIAQKHNVAVIEDACQAHLAVYDHKVVGSIGKAGCFSFQNSKNLPIGEGGAIVSNDDRFIDNCFAAHNLGYAYGTSTGAVAGDSFMKASKIRLTEYAAAIGLAQLKRLEEQTNTRHENAAYLSSMIKDIPGIQPIKLYDKVNRGAYHLYSFRYDPASFKGLTRAKFMDALRKEGIPCSGGYKEMHTQEFMRQTFGTRVYKSFYSQKMLDFEDYKRRNHCPENAALCNSAVWMTQNMLLGSRKDMEGIAEAIKGISNNAGKI
ncbi:DegT/DnrJ/EryC1/StrS family aminotransferase [Chitinophaga sp. GCM10012297]|uniref:DegT/DnrJ/EryC1/StrS family aminotransferase n=1 Tax=Chitinophaga chungangae TaxID=2821488 RepID=A0ABS3YIH6_9BACT|nr:DegT/DnrJ/EryC1/StrS family aminotransferase [Chitinophaga chungangae]MBO9154497.1 DegT/DnrJ/EryC1/StrS family aminotransferase [Chitinophaga chungangae]